MKALEFPRFRATGTEGEGEEAGDGDAFDGGGVCVVAVAVPFPLVPITAVTVPRAIEYREGGDICARTCGRYWSAPDGDRGEAAAAEDEDEDDDER